MAGRRPSAASPCSTTSSPHPLPAGIRHESNTADDPERAHSIHTPKLRSPRCSAGGNLLASEWLQPGSDSAVRPAGEIIPRGDASRPATPHASARSIRGNPNHGCGDIRRPGSECSEDRLGAARDAGRGCRGLGAESARSMLERGEERGWIEASELDAFGVECELARADIDVLTGELERIGIEVRQLPADGVALVRDEEAVYEPGPA